MVRNPNYLRKQGLEAHRTWDENSRLIDTTWLYWEDYLYGNVKFPYRLMQPPGPKNALGKIKFKFPNRFSVYLHDTPTRHLFKKTVRAFSHGCVRLSQPEDLLQTISEFNPKIDMTKAKKTLKGKRKTFLKVNNQLRIYLVYLTAGMNDKGQIEFRNDIYNYDKYQKRRLR
jgi:murein L,D-transpeptidase YcbB/YkuD